MPYGIGGSTLHYYTINANSGFVYILLIYHYNDPTFTIDEQLQMHYRWAFRFRVSSRSLLSSCFGLLVTLVEVSLHLISPLNFQNFNLAFWFLPLMRGVLQHSLQIAVLQVSFKQQKMGCFYLCLSIMFTCYNCARFVQESVTINFSNNWIPVMP